MIERDRGERIPASLAEIKPGLALISPDSIESYRNRLSAYSSVVTRDGDHHYVSEASGQLIGEGGGRAAFTEHGDFKVREEIITIVREMLTGKAGQEGRELKEESSKDEKGIYTIFPEYGITIWNSPAGLVVTYAPSGTDDKKKPLRTGSHLDTPEGNAGREDGQGGIAVTLEMLRCMIESKYIPESPIQLVFDTAEESGKRAFLGAAMFAQGIEDIELDIRLEIGLSVREAIERWRKYFHADHFDISCLSAPLLPQGRCYIEPHAFPGKLDEKIILAAPESIPAARRFEIIVEPIEKAAKQAVEVMTSKYTQALTIKTTGTPGHHASFKPDEKLSALDRLARFFPNLKQAITEVEGIEVYIVEMGINGKQAMNVVPGEAEMTLVVAGDTKETVTNVIQTIEAAKEEHNERHLWPYPCKYPIVISHSPTPPTIDSLFYDAQTTFRSFEITARMINIIERNINFLGRIANGRGNIGILEYNPSGEISFNVDVRSTDLHWLNDCISSFLETIILGYPRAGRKPIEEIAVAGTLMTEKQLKKIFLASERSVYDAILYHHVDSINNSEQALGHRYMDFPLPTHVINFNGPLPGSVDPLFPSKDLHRVIQDVARDLYKQYVRKFPITAGESGQVFQHISDMVNMIFVQQQGVTHQPSEYVEPEHWAMAAATLWGTLHQVR